MLYTVMITAVNGHTFANRIILNYFAAGHTFMSADSVHHGIEHEMRKAKNIYD